MYSFDFVKRVRYGETDMMGYLYYGNYAQLYEIGRVETMRSLGLSYKDMEAVHRVMMPVVHVESRYLKPAKYDDALTIRTILNEMPNKAVVFHAEIYNEDNTLIHTAAVKLLFIDMDNQKRVSCPEYLVQALKPYF
jgi:acyl-CoA thioester hydrolase